MGLEREREKGKGGNALAERLVSLSLSRMPKAFWRSKPFSCQWCESPISDYAQALFFSLFESISYLHLSLS